jgi:hypothetical protein
MTISATSNPEYQPRRPNCGSRSRLRPSKWDDMAGRDKSVPESDRYRWPTILSLARTAVLMTALAVTLALIV